MAGQLANWAMNKVLQAIMAGAKLVPNELYIKRKEVCAGCPLLKQVEPMPGLKMPGCSMCGCPTATKPKYYSIPRAKDKHGTPLTFEEMITAIIPTEDKTHELITCPHPDGNKWAEVDSLFLNN